MIHILLKVKIFPFQDDFRNSVPHDQKCNLKNYEIMKKKSNVYEIFVYKSIFKLNLSNKFLNSKIVWSVFTFQKKSQSPSPDI